MTRTVHVHAPCRLHFGMFSFGHADQPQFGGVGVSIAPPAVEITIRPAAQFTATGTLAERVEQFAATVARAWKLQELPKCEVVVHSPPDHVGLGVGTQLGLAVAAGLRRFLQLSELPVEELAADVGRGMRSAIGTYGLERGGLIVDAGKVPGQRLAKPATRVAVPEDWRFVLVCDAEHRGLAGKQEADAFARLPPVPPNVTHELWRITNEEMLPAIERSNCSALGDAVYRFGRLAGECFAAAQGGPFATADVGRLVAAIRDHGVAGVGQSSWGPTVFAIVSNDAEAQSLVAWLRKKLGLATADCTVAQPNNRGAHLSVS